MAQKGVFKAYKNLGETPLESIQRLQKEGKLPKNKKIAYAGRLDPMAEGLLLLLIEPETKNRDAYQKLDKSYEFEVLFGAATDTFDTLGLITAKSEKGKVPEKKLTTAIAKFVGKQKQKYPPYSSVLVKGKPLFWWAKNGKLKNITIPSKEIEIYSIKIARIYQITKDKLQRRIAKQVSFVKGDFRQESILLTWNNFFKETKKKSFSIAKIKIACSSGTYVRQLVADLGSLLNVPLATLHIKRTAVGKFKLTT